MLDEVGTPRDFAAEGFEPKDHLTLAEGLGALDMERGAKVSGSRFYFLKGVGARLEMAMLQLAMQRAIEAGFVPMITPTLVKAEVMAGAGFLDHHADEVYRLEADDLYLTGTSEVALAGYHADEIIDLSQGPVRYAGQSTCYRREAGSYGKDTRGIIRVHQFNKIEMFVYCRPEDADGRAPAPPRRSSGRCSRLMELPYRVIDTAAGDLGGPAARKYDCEAWVPTQGRHRELTSTLELHDLPGPPPQDPLPRRRAAAPRWPPRSTARSPRRAGSSPSSRTTSRPTAPSSSRQALRPLIGLDVLTPA